MNKYYTNPLLTISTIISITTNKNCMIEIIKKVSFRVLLEEEIKA